MLLRIVLFVSGIAYIFLGFDIIRKGRLHYFGSLIAKGESIFPVGVFSIVFGMLLVWLGVRKKTGRVFKEEYLACPECKEVYSSDKVPDRRCPKCDAELERLEGYYDRHPGLKDSDEKKPHKEM